MQPSPGCDSCAATNEDCRSVVLGSIWGSSLMKESATPCMQRVEMKGEGRQGNGWGQRLGQQLGEGPDTLTSYCANGCCLVLALPTGP